MTRQIHKLTAKAANAIKEPGNYSDGGGLYLQVSKGLTKSWTFVYISGKKRTEIGLGSFVDVSLAEAREKAAEYRKMRLNDLDPLTEKRRRKQESKLSAVKTVTFKQCAGMYIETHSPQWKSAKHAQQWHNTLNQYAYPLFGDLAVEQVDLGLIMRCLEPIWLTKNETANRVRGRIESILDFATVRQFRNGDNPARWRGHLDHLLPKPGKVKEVENHPALPYKEINTFIQDLRRQNGIAPKALEFLILTSVRTGDVLGAKWQEINREEKTWTIPGERLKSEKNSKRAKTPHRVPLTKRALELIDAMQTIRLNDFVFPGQSKTGGLSCNAMLAVLKRMERNDITPHGFRSTFKDWAMEKNGDRLSSEMALAHIVGGVEGAYFRTDLYEKRIKLMAEWADFIETPVPESSK